MLSDEAVTVGSFISKLWHDKDYPHIQILAVEGLLNGNERIDVPPQLNPFAGRTRVYMRETSRDAVTPLWVQSIALILTPSCVIVVLGFLGRSAMRQFLGRNLEAHKVALSTTSEREIESLKAELRRVTYEHEVTFGKLHAERADAVKSLYQKALALGSAARSFASGREVETDVDFQACRKAVDDALNGIYGLMFESRIFLSEELCVKTDDLLRDIIEPASDIAGGYLLPLRSPGERLSARLSDKRKLEEATWRLEAEIAAEFRKLLGVK